MKKKIKISLILSLAIIFGCFSNVFASTNQNNKIAKIAEVKKSVRLLDGTNNNGLDQYTKLLMHMDDDTFKDECGQKVENTGVTFDTNNKKFGKGSASFNGTGSYLTIPASKDWDLGNKDFTLECWIKLSANSNKNSIVGCGGISGTSLFSWSFYKPINCNYVAWYCTTGTGMGTYMFSENFPTVSDDLFHHYEVDRQGNNFYFFLDGNLVNTVNNSSSIKSDTQSVIIGNQSGVNEYFKGNIDELRLSVGIARHTSKFIPPTAPYGDTLATGISLNKTADILILESIGNTDTLTATVIPDNVTSKTVKWTSSDPTIVSVDENGKITALKAGTATITATTTDGSNLSKSCTVTVNEPTNITLDKTTDLINVGDTDKITASVTPAGQDVTWTSSDEGIVKVDQNGNITGLKAGTAIITATTADGKKASCTVTVKDQELDKSKLIIYMGNQVTREYYLTEDEVGNFIDWYDARANDQTPKSYYVFKVPAQGVLPARKDYVLFDKIKAFEVE